MRSKVQGLGTVYSNLFNLIIVGFNIQPNSVMTSTSTIQRQCYQCRIVIVVICFISVTHNRVLSIADTDSTTTTFIVVLIYAIRVMTQYSLPQHFTVSVQFENVPGVNTILIFRKIYGCHIRNNDFVCGRIHCYCWSTWIRVIVHIELILPFYCTSGS